MRHSVDHVERFAHRALGRRMSHDDQGHSAIVAVAIVLDDRRDRNPIAAQDPGDIGQHARPIGHVEPQIEPPARFGMIGWADVRPLVGPELERAERDRRPPDDRVDQVRHDRRGGRHLPGP